MTSKNEGAQKAPKIISRQEAIQTGEKLYFTGEPCHNGHLSPRYTVSGSCRECAINHVKADRKSIMKSLLEARGDTRKLTIDTERLQTDPSVSNLTNSEIGKLVRDVASGERAASEVGFIVEQGGAK